MKKFSFSLEKILAYRMQLEEQAKMLLAKAQHAYQRQVAVIEEIRTNIINTEKHLCSPEPLTPGESWLWRGYRQRLQQDLSAAERKMLELAKALNDRRREAVLRSKDRKLLEKLKERQAEQHLAEENAKEQREFDEMATIRYEHADF